MLIKEHREQIIHMLERYWYMSFYAHQDRARGKAFENFASIVNEHETNRFLLLIEGIVAEILMSDYVCNGSCKKKN